MKGLRLFGKYIINNGGAYAIALLGCLDGSYLCDGQCSYFGQGCHAIPTFSFV
jgi:hypothetical protein